MVLSFGRWQHRVITRRTGTLPERSLPGCEADIVDGMSEDGAISHMTRIWAVRGKLARR